MKIRFHSEHVASAVTHPAHWSSSSEVVWSATC